MRITTTESTGVTRGAQPHVVLLACWMTFPNGMAATNRARLLARAACEAGVPVHVLLLQAGDRGSVPENVDVRGQWYGVTFEYAAGTTRRHPSFSMRRLIELRGWIAGAVRLLQLRQAGRLDVVYLWFTSQRLEPRRLAYLLLLHVLRVPVVIELNERPWPMRDDESATERRWSPLRGVSGAVSISRRLSEWAHRESAGRSRPFTLMEIPIVVDATERAVAPYPGGEPLVVFAGAPEYDDAIRFILTAMRVVWQNVPSCRIIITGAEPSDPAARWLGALSRDADARVTLAGYLKREELLALYARASALLVPLFDDVRSHARFPTKIGEYLASGRPVVTNAVGEITRYFEDGVNACVCPPGDPAAFGEAIAALLLDRERASAVGLAGRRLAESRFHYALYGEELRRGFASVARGGDA